MTKRYVFLSFATLVATLAPTITIAQQATTTLPVSANVVKACSVAANPLNFGDYDPTSTIDLEGSTSLDVLCTLGTSYTVGFSSGTGTAATVTSRTMISGVDELSYQLFQEASFTNNWGETPGTDTPPATTAGAIATQHAVYGRIPAGQIVPAGAYADTITVTVNY